VTEKVAVSSGPTTQESQWTKCPSCDAFVYGRRLDHNLKVCPECDHHFRLPVRERLRQLLDPGSFEGIADELEPRDVLGFEDSKTYPARLEAAQLRSGSKEAALAGTATIDGMPLVVAAMDFSFMGGSMGGVTGEIITLAIERAADTRTPLLIVAASGGARMQEGCVSLMQLAKTSQALARLNEAGVLSICLLTDPTYGGVTASFAVLGDVLIAEPRAMVGFAGPSVIEQTIRQQLPAGFQTAEFLRDHGMLDLVERREDLRNVLRKLLRYQQGERPTSLPGGHGRPPVTDPDALEERPAWDVVMSARDAGRPTTLEYTGYIFDEFLELQGDRLYAEDAAIVGGLARLGELSLVVIGHQKGHNTSELVARNFGMPNPEGYRKSLRLMELAAKFGFPVVTFIDTPGAYPGLGAEERGQAVAIAQSMMAMSRLPVPVVCIVTGEGGSGGALALGVGDRVLMLENSYYSVISPEGCSTILFSNAAAAPRAASALRVTAPDLLRLKVMDAVVPEPEGGAHTDAVTTAANVKEAIVACLDELLALDTDELLRGRYDRFRIFGRPDLQPSLTRPE
jgi:acyl-CoA carboxylase subunit beta